MRVELGNAGGNIHVELVKVDVIAAPGELLAVGGIRGEDDADDSGGLAGGAVVSGNPLWGDEGDGAGFYGEVDVGVVEAARGFGEVGGDADGSLLGEGGGGK